MNADALAEADYQARLAAEGRKWGAHLQVEASGKWNAWLDHPWISQHYHARALVEGQTWAHWVRKPLQGPARRSLDLGCGSGRKSAAVFAACSTLHATGFDLSEERIAEARQLQSRLGIPGEFAVADANRLDLPADSFDLVFASHSFHHFLDLERIMDQVHRALTPRGIFVLEEYVGPSQFQWTDAQMSLVASRLALMPERLRVLPWGTIKDREGRPAPSDVAAVSPFESIRSAEIEPLFRERFEMVAARRLGGTLQQLLYNGIMHNFVMTDAESLIQIRGVAALEDALLDHGVLPSDCMLLIGRRRDARAP